METAYIKSPLGITKIIGSESGISVISILNDETEISSEIPKILKEAISQLQEYFDGSRQNFTFKLNPSGTDSSRKCGGNC